VSVLVSLGKGNQLGLIHQGIIWREVQKVAARCPDPETGRKVV
jgi:hypothetical protein